MKKYVIQETEFNTLNDLGVWYSENFEAGLEDIFQHTKKFIKFVRSFNKKLAKEIAVYFSTCKYQNNILTFIIFALCEDKKVVLNGDEYTFREFVESFIQDSKVSYAFMEDFGITRTYATLNIEPKLEKDAYFIEKNIKDPFTTEYLKTFYKFDYVESLQSHIANVFINEDERFRRAVKIVRSERFQMILAHKVGFRDVFKMHEKDMPLFDAVRLLTCEFVEEDLVRVLQDTFYWWLYDNFDKYVYKKDAKKLLKSFKDLVQEKKTLDKKYTYDGYVSFCNKLFDNYISFVSYMKKDLIQVKSKYSVEDYTLDKLYCNTYICLDYMKNHTVKLKVENIEKPVDTDLEEDENKPEPVEAKVEEEPIFVPKESQDIPKGKIKKQEKAMNKMRRFGTFAILFDIVSLLFFGGILIVKMLPIEIEFPEEIAGLGIMIGFGIAFVLCLILCIILKIFAEKTIKNLADLKLIYKVRDEDLRLNHIQERNYNSLKNKEEKIRKKAMRGHRILSMIICTLLGFVSSIAAIFIVTLLSSFVSIIPWEKGYLENSLKVLYYLSGAGIGLIYGLIRKRKGAWTAILVALLGLGIVVGLGFIL